MCIEFLFILFLVPLWYPTGYIFCKFAVSQSMSDGRTSYKVLHSIRGTRPILKVLGKNDLINVGLFLVYFPDQKCCFKRQYGKEDKSDIKLFCSARVQSFVKSLYQRNIQNGLLEDFFSFSLLPHAEDSSKVLASSAAVCSIRVLSWITPGKWAS